LHDCPKEIDAILLEGTMLGREDEVPVTEAEIEAEAVKLIEKANGITLFYSSGQNIDRLVSFYRAARRLEKNLVIDIYTAHILQSLHGRAKLPYPSEKYPEIRVFYPFWLSQRLVSEGRKDLLYDFRREWISREEISKSANEIVMLVRPSMVSDLEHIPGLEGGIFIYSLWKGYLKENYVQRLLEFSKSRKMAFHYLHTSGHAYWETLKKVVNGIKPKRIIPIHTFHPELFNTIGENVHSLQDGEVLEL